MNHHCSKGLGCHDDGDDDDDDVDVIYEDYKLVQQAYNCI